MSPDTYMLKHKLRPKILKQQQQSYRQKDNHTEKITRG